MLAETFDVVYTSIGTITWLSDLTRWAQQIAKLLSDGGIFYIRDGHPMLYTLDEMSPELTVRYRYFGDGTPNGWDVDSTYAGDGKLAHAQTYEYPHPISEILNALIGAGLTIERFDEGTSLPWQFSPFMEWSDAKDGFVWKDEQNRSKVPLTYTIVAKKAKR